MGGGEIMCQHGEDECFGNRLHNCAKQQMSPPEMSKFVVCMEEKLMSGMTAQDPQSMEPCLPRPDLSAQLTQCAAQHQCGKGHHGAFCHLGRRSKFGRVQHQGGTIQA